MEDSWKKGSEKKSSHSSCVVSGSRITGRWPCSFTTPASAGPQRQENRAHREATVCADSCGRLRRPLLSQGVGNQLLFSQHVEVTGGTIQSVVRFTLSLE